MYIVTYEKQSRNDENEWIGYIYMPKDKDEAKDFVSFLFDTNDSSEIQDVKIWNATEIPYDKKVTIEFDE